MPEAGTYSAQVHGLTDGKEACRAEVNKLVLDMAGDTGIAHIDGLSLPSTAGYQEMDLYRSAEAAGISSHFTCVERDLGVHVRMKYANLPPAVDYNNCSFEDQLSRLRKSRTMLDWFWFDSCGHALSYAKLDGSNLQTFIDALKGNLKPVGIGFFTAGVMPYRMMSASDQYAICTGNRIDDVSHDQMMGAYLDILRKELPKDFDICSDIRYKVVSGHVFFMLGVSKNWWGHPPHKPVEVF